MFVFSIKVSLLSKHKQIQIVNKIKYFIFDKEKIEKERKDLIEKINQNN